MIRLTLVDHTGKTVTPQELTTLADLQETAERARALIRECDRLAQLKTPPRVVAQPGGVPYST